MRYVTFGRSGLKVSRIALGTFQFSGGWGEFDADDASDLIRTAFDSGITFFDTARAYGFGRAERLLGDALAGPLKAERDSIVIATKGGLRFAEDGRRVRDSSEAALREGLEESLRDLGIDHVDVFLLHWPDPGIPIEETAGVLDGFVDEGLIRWHGVSNHTTAEMAPLVDHPAFAAVQPPYSLLRKSVEHDLLPFCERHEIGVMAYGTLAHGLLTGKYGPGDTFIGWRGSSPLFQGETYATNVQMASRLADLAAEWQLAVPELATSWALAHPSVQTAVMGASSGEQLQAILSAGDVVLTEAQVGLVEELANTGVQVGGPSPEGGVSE